MSWPPFPWPVWFKSPLGLVLYSDAIWINVSASWPDIWLPSATLNVGRSSALLEGILGLVRKEGEFYAMTLFCLL